MIIKNKHILLFIFIILWYILTRSCEYRDGFNVGIENKPKWKIRDGYNCAFANTEKYLYSPNILNECKYYGLLQWPLMQECNETFYTNDEGINKMCHFENFNCSKTNDNLPESLPNYYNTIDCRKITLKPHDGGDALLNRLRKAYNQKGSNGVFISMIFNLHAIYDGLIYLDGSGSIINNNVYIDFWGEACTFGFIWDTDWLNKEIRHVRKWAKILNETFRQLNINTISSSVNFLLINFDKAKKTSKQVFYALAKQGILLRQMNVYSIKNSLRVTVGNRKENLKLIVELKKILNV